MRPKHERLLDLITDDWRTASELSIMYVKEGAKKTALNSYQIGTLCRGLIKQGLVEFQIRKMKISGAWRKVREYRKKHPLCPKCKEPLRRVGCGTSTSQNPSVCPITPPYWKCDKCGIGSYNLKDWYNRQGKINIKGIS